MSKLLPHISREGHHALGDSKKIFTDFIAKPILSGIIGFTLFLLILVVTKWISYLLGTQQNFIVETDDLFLSSIGFVLIGLIKLIENFRQEKD